jgi:hypothetical protein
MAETGRTMAKNPPPAMEGLVLAQTHLADSLSQWFLGSSPEALSTDAGIAVDFVHTLGPILAEVVPAVVLILTAVVTCIARCTLTPGKGVSHKLRPELSSQGSHNLCMRQSLKCQWICGDPQSILANHLPIK